MTRALIPWQWVRISGPSMVPTLSDGDAVVVRHGAPIVVGDVVLASFRTLPTRLVVKRTVCPREGGWWLASDNAFAGGDSAMHGVADVHARVSWVIRGVLPRRVARRPDARASPG